MANKTINGSTGSSSSTRGTSIRKTRITHSENPTKTIDFSVKGRYKLLEQLLTRVTKLEKDVKQLKEDVKELKQEMTALKKQVSSLESSSDNEKTNK